METVKNATPSAEVVKELQSKVESLNEEVACLQGQLRNSREEAEKYKSFWVMEQMRREHVQSDVDNFMKVLETFKNKW